MDVDWAIENQVIPFVPLPTVAVTGQRTFPLGQLFTLPRYTMQKYASWSNYIDILKRIIDDVIAEKYIGSATFLSEYGWLLKRWRDYGRWLPTDNVPPNKSSPYRRMAMLTGDDAMELNFRVLPIGFDPEELRFVPLFNEGLWAAFFKNIDLRGYNDDNQ